MPNVNPINPIIYFNQQLSWQRVMQFGFLFTLVVGITESNPDKKFPHLLNFGIPAIIIIIFWIYHAKLLRIRYKLRKIKPNMHRDLTLSEKALLREYLAEFKTLKYSPQLHILVLILSIANVAGADIIDSKPGNTMSAQTVFLSYLAIFFMSMDIPKASVFYFPFAFAGPTITSLYWYYIGLFSGARILSLLGIVLSSIWIAFVLSLDKKDAVIITARYDPLITPAFLEIDPDLNSMWELHHVPSSSSPQSTGHPKTDDFFRTSVELDDVPFSENSPSSSSARISTNIHPDPSTSHTSYEEDHEHYPDYSPASTSAAIHYHTPLQKFTDSLVLLTSKINNKIHPVREHFRLWLDQIDTPKQHFYNQILARIKVTGAITSIGQSFLFLAYSFVIFLPTDESGRTPTIDFQNRYIPLFVAFVLRFSGIIWALTGLYFINRNGTPDNIILTPSGEKVHRLGPTLLLYIIVCYILFGFTSIFESLTVAGNIAASVGLNHFRLSLYLFFVYPISSRTGFILHFINGVANICSILFWNIETSVKIIDIVGTTLSYLVLPFVRIRWFSQVYPLRLREIRLISHRRVSSFSFDD